MKKLMFFLTALALVSQAHAEVQITCEATGNEVTVSWNATTEADLVRIFTLDVTVDNGATIVSAPLNSFHPDYWLYPAGIEVNPVTGEIDDTGSPIADRNLYEVGSDSYNDTLPGLGSFGMTIEAGSLYRTDETPPPPSGELFQFTVDQNCNVTIAENQIREGIVLEGANPMSSFSSPGCTVGFCDTCTGDLSGDDWLSPDDISALVSELLPYASAYYWVPTPPGSCGDIASDDWLSPEDVSALVSVLLPYESSYYWKPCE